MMHTVNNISITISSYGPKRFMVNCDVNELSSFDLKRAGKVIIPFIHKEHEGNSECFGSAIFGGYLFNHFGHFLLENVPRVYDSGDRVIVFFSRTQQCLSSWQLDILNYLQVASKVVILKSAKFENISFQDPGFEIKTFFRFNFLSYLRRIDQFSYRSLSKIWLSRSDVSLSNGVVVNEDIIERSLESEGWLILRPENMSVTDLLFHLSKAQIIAGFQGSAFHNLLLLTRLRCPIYIGRFEMNENFNIISDHLDHNTCFIDIDPYQTAGFRSRKSFILRNNPFPFGPIFENRRRWSWYDRICIWFISLKIGAKFV